MALTLGDNFSYLGTKPLDGRIKYSTISEMVAMSDTTLYDGIIAYCVADGKNYQWKSTNDVDVTLGKWREFSSGGGAVDSVNGKTGVVVLDAEDVGALPDNTSIPDSTSDLTNDSGFITSVPVTSVNSKTGEVVLNASDVGALASNTTYVSSVNGSSGAVTISVPTKTSDLQNDSGFLTSAVTTFNGQSGAVTYSAPVSSVNGQTGAVTGLQTTANLVTSVSSSSTDSQYPSAKCLYDMVGDIETLLASI